MAWLFKVDTFDQYFDDLESFAWVLLWASIEIAEAKGGATGYDRELMKALNKDDLNGQWNGKENVASQLNKLSERTLQDRPEAYAT
jgi:hypothetical protein